jgi:hypothetical protein
MAKKIAGLIVVIFLVFFIAYHPANAAQMTQRIGSLVAEVGRGFGDFFTRLVS